MKKLMPRRTHIRIFLGSCLLFVLVSVPVVFFMTRQFSSFALDQIDKVNKTELAHSRDNAAFILDKMIAYGFTMYADKSVQAWMTADEETQDREIEAIAAAAKYRTTEPFLKNAYLLNMRTGHVIDIAYGITTFAAFKDQAILELAKAPAKAYQRFFVHRAGGERSLALMIPTVPSGQPSYGYLVLLLDDALMKQYLLKENKAAGFISFMLDDEGRMMLGPDEEERAAAASETPGAAASETPGASNEGLYKELASRAEGASGSFEQRYDRESWSVQYARIEPQGWTLYLMAKLDGIHADFYAFRTKLMVVLAGLVALLLAILFWNSRRTYRPFSQLASHLETKLGPSLQRGQAGGPLAEHSVIRYGIELLENRMVALDSSMREHRDVIKTEYLRQWILQGKLIPPVEQYLREHSGLFAYGELYIGAIRIDGYSAFKEKYEFASRKLMKYAMCNIAEEILRRDGAAEGVDLGSDHVVLLLSGDGMSAERLTTLLEEVKAQIDRWTQIRVTVAVSEARAFGDDIRAAYQHILELTMLKFVSGEDKIYAERDFEDYMRSVQPLPDDQLLDELIKSVRMGKPEDTAAGLDRLFAHMQTMHYAQSKIQLSLMLYTLFKAFNKLPSVASIEGIERILASFDTLAGVRAWLERELLVIIEELSSKKGASRRDEIVTDIVDYVRNRLHDPMLTVEEIAEHVSLSSRHVRQLFKESLDVTLSEYILQERIAKVKELLATTDWTVTDIGERAGFQTKSHFFTIFKKATGLTPSQYRDTAL